MDYEKQLMSLIKATKMLTSTQNLDEVLHLINKEALSVFNWADAIVLFLYDETKDHLRAKSSIGFDIDHLKHVRLKPGEAMTGKTFNLKKAQIYTSNKQTAEGMSDIRPENFEWYKKALGRNSVPTSSISAPLMTKDECYGVLVIDSYSNEVTFTLKHLNLLHTFADQAIIAIENATLISQNRRSHQIHQALTEVYMSQKGLAEITKTIAQLTGKTFCVFDEFLNVLSVSDHKMESFFKKYVIEKNINLNQAFADERVMHQEISNKNKIADLHYFAIYIGQEIRGLLVAMTEDDLFLDSLDIFAIEQATTVFALEIQSQFQFISSAFQYSGQLIDKLKENYQAVIQEPFVKKVNDEAHHFIIFSIEFLASYHLQKSEDIQPKLSRLLYYHLSQLTEDYLVKVEGLRYTILLSMREDKPSDQIYQLINTLLKGVKNTVDLSFYCGSGRQFNHLRDLALSIKDADKSIAYLKLQGRENDMMTYEKLGAYRLFLNIDNEEINNYIAKQLAKVIHYDQSHGTELLSTLDNYLRQNQNMRLTAEFMFVHINTIKYRINKVKQLLTIDNFTGDLVFEYQLALKLLHFKNKNYMSEMDE